jgi:hypothetical protein
LSEDRQKENRRKKYGRKGGKEGIKKEKVKQHKDTERGKNNIFNITVFSHIIS